MKDAAIALVLGLVICPLTTRADAPVVDIHVQAATELLLAMNVDKQMALGSQAMADLLIQQNPMLGPYKDVLLKWAASFMTWDTFGARLIALYEDSFTESELRDISAFYKTPTGQKALTVLPELGRRMMEIGGAEAKKHSQELEAMIRDRAAEIQKLTAKP